MNQPDGLVDKPWRPEFSPKTHMVEGKNWLCQLTALVMPAKSQSSLEGGKIRVYRLLPFLKEQNLAKAMLSDSS